MSMDFDNPETDPRLGVNESYLARKTRAGRAWREIRSRLPENLPLPKRLLVARIIVVVSIVLFAAYSAVAVLGLRPLREQAASQSSWMAQVSLSRRWLTQAMLSGVRTEETVEEELRYLVGRLDTLTSDRPDAGRPSPQTISEAVNALELARNYDGVPTNLAPILESLEILQRSIRTEEARLHRDLERQSNVLTFLVAGALVLCCVTLLLMEQSNRAKEKVASLRFRATHDPLTRGLNRSAILSLAARELNRTKRVGKALAIFLVDMDHFKEINDRFGHPVGDAVIKQTATRLRRKVRVYDAVGRYGGDEFLVVLPDCDRKDAEIIAERLRAAFDVPLDLGEAKKIVSICIGGAIFNGGDTDVEELIVRADQALYRAKEAGRNGWAIMDAPIPALGKSEAGESDPEEQGLGELAAEG